MTMHDAKLLPEIEPLRLYWWNEQMNFGDDLSKDIVAYVSGRPVVWARPVRADLFAIGSIMFKVRRGSLARSSGRKPRIWGTGCMVPIKSDFIEAIDAPAVVRGPITAALLDLDAVTFGDPGLLTCLVYDGLPTQGDKIGIVPHHTEVDHPMIDQLVQSDSVFLKIDTRRPAIDVCADIASCSKVYSSSLHGLIVADSLSIENHWFVKNKIHNKAAIKFYDYAAGIERPLARPVDLADVMTQCRSEPVTSLSYQDGIERSQHDLVAYFPHDTVALQRSSETTERLGKGV